MSSYKPKMVLGIEADAKTVKGNKYNVLTGILYLAPADSAAQIGGTPALANINVCPMAERAQCKAGCLYTAGRGAMRNVQDARVAKTRRFFLERGHFMLDLAHSIRVLIRQAHKRGMTPMVRLNGTSDILWENTPFEYGGRHYKNLMELFPTTQFYDYTKIPTRKNLPPNYDLTFSYSGVPGYQGVVRKAVTLGMRIAVVFRRAADIPATFMGRKVVDGDDSDVRVKDARGVVVGLYAKGRAKHDTSGFVVG